MAAFDWGPLLESGPLFIGILNLTPDSFSDGGRFLDPSLALEQARRLVEKRFRMLDLGAESTRPGAKPVASAEEWARLEPTLSLLRRELPGIPLSLDTRHAEVAERGLAAGVAVLNDVTGFSDPAMLALATRSGCGLIAMRSRLEGGHFVMPPYNAPGETTGNRARSELEAVRHRLAQAGIAATRVALDPGFGFGTTFEEDSAMWRSLPEIPGPLCIGISRKRFVAWKAGQPDLPPAERDGPTATLHAEAAAWGASIFRSHAATLA